MFSPTIHEKIKPSKHYNVREKINYTLNIKMVCSRTPKNLVKNENVLQKSYKRRGEKKETKKEPKRKRKKEIRNSDF